MFEDEAKRGDEGGTAKVEMAGQKLKLVHSVEDRPLYTVFMLGVQLLVLHARVQGRRLETSRLASRHIETDHLGTGLVVGCTTKQHCYYALV